MKAAGALLNALLAALFAIVAWRAHRDGDWWWPVFAFMVAGNIVLAVLKLRSGRTRAEG